MKLLLCRLGIHDRHVLWNRWNCRRDTWIQRSNLGHFPHTSTELRGYFSEQPATRVCLRCERHETLYFRSVFSDIWMEASDAKRTEAEAVENAEATEAAERQRAQIAREILRRNS